MRFLSGHDGAVLADLAVRMDHASEKLDYELAAHYRDQIAAIKEIQARQVVTGIRTRDADGLAVYEPSSSIEAILLVVPLAQRSTYLSC